MESEDVTAAQFQTVFCRMDILPDLIKNIDMDLLISLPFPVGMMELQHMKVAALSNLKACLEQAHMQEQVLMVLEVGTSCEYAVKCVYLNTDQEMAQGYINEVRLLRELQNSDRVIRLFD
ncbi:unnamed protein product [Leptidea sinapis]|uniref:Protein kinase domain-containing protein n=1 Tax=Leptidea sinapis TaxID=189913 RepID=A0A5E4QW49_9NEOP|nr:unnamed protein product [Leptidea sinapis]